MASDPSAAGQFGVYVCPVCKHALRHEQDVLRCPACCQAYPIVEGILEFLSEELSQSPDPELRRMRFIDRMAGIYETRLWYPLVLKVYGGLHSPSLGQLIGAVSEEVRAITGPVLDVACGPGTFGRRIASPAREVWGIDVSRGMLRQGAAYVAAEGISNMHFARARVEALPFADGLFAATVCCGSLHLFTDTLIALREMARVMKPGAVLAVFTFTAGDRGILRFRSIRQWSRRHHGLHVFELPELEQCLAAAGFDNLRPKVTGSILTFSARRRNAALV
jgi:SAM-dependent methyltransferase